MPPEGSVTHWLGELQEGDPVAAQKLWERYFDRLVGVARAKLQGQARRAADEEDAALSAFDSFCRGVEEGRFPQLRDRHNLWRLLVIMTVRKAQHFLRDERRQKRGGRAVSTVSGSTGPKGFKEAAADLEQFVGREPSPEFAAQVAEEFQRLLGILNDAELRSIALWKLEGDTNAQIAAKLECALSTVERRLGVIRRLWEKESTS